MKAVWDARWFILDTTRTLVPDSRGGIHFPLFLGIYGFRIHTTDDMHLPLTLFSPTHDSPYNLRSELNKAHSFTHMFIPLKSVPLATESPLALSI